MEAAVRRRIRVLAPAAAIAAAAVLSSCAAGQSAQTAYEKPTLDGTSADIGKIAIRGLALESPGSRPFFPAGSSAKVRMVIVNTGGRADRLTSITGSAIGGWSSYGTGGAAAQVQAAGPKPAAADLPPSSRSVTVQPGLRVSYGTPDANMSMLVMKFTKRVYPGSIVQLTFTFANSGSKTIPVPVSLSEKPDSSVVPGPSATGQAG